MEGHRPLFPLQFWSSAMARAAATLPAVAPSAPTVTTEGPWSPSPTEIAITGATNLPTTVFPSSTELAATRSPKTPTSGNVEIAIASPSNESNSPSKESRTTVQEISRSSDKERSNSGVSEQESQQKPETKYNGYNEITTPSQKLGSKQKPDEVKEAKEIAQETIPEAKEEFKGESLKFLNPVYKRDIDEKVLPANILYPTKKQSPISDAHRKSGPPEGEDLSLSPLQNDIKNYVSKFINWMAVGDLKDSVYNKSASVITLSGENKGALMKIWSNSSETEDQDLTGCDLKPDECADAEEVCAEDQPEAYVNNNAQGINNSIVFDGNITERNPGVHMALVTHVPEEPIQSTDKTSPVET